MISSSRQRRPAVPVNGWEQRRIDIWNSTQSAVQACCDSPSLSSAPSSKVPRQLLCASLSSFWSPAIADAAGCHQLSVPWVRRSAFGTRAFSVARPTVWNSLPDHLHDPAVDSEQLAERRSLAGELTLSCARPSANGWPLCG